MNKLDMLAQLSDKICKCDKCPELVKSRTQTVFGEGDPNAKILFLGEAPGRDEDESGRPFVGKAGRLLDNILEACDLQREEVYICNVVKCRPEYNRTPWPVEATNCRPYLELQVKIINPKVIVCLGTVAAQKLLKLDTPVSKLRGSWYDYTNKPVKAKVRVTFHPAYLLRNPAAKSDVWEDMQEVLKCVKR